MMNEMKKYKVYCLKDKDRKIIYVGQTRMSLSKRMTAHRAEKKLDKTVVIELVADFDTPEPMYELEARLIKQYNLVEEGLNKSYGYEDVPKQFSQEGEQNGFYGHKHSDDMRRKIGQRSIGNKYAKGNPSRKGRKNSEYHKQMVSEKKSVPVMCIETGIVYKSGREAAEALGLCRSKISNVCHGKRNTTGGLHFKFVNIIDGVAK